ncbi:MAG: SLBB domain-containing protein [Planctomycetota bacterium]|nr:SLBB domain-containing protein [Planctomycetota bacterium]
MTDISAEQIAAAGVVGAGGAGFPTHVKLAGNADTVLINAAECEPLLHKDKELILAYADDIISGTAMAMRLTGAERAVIGVKEKYTDVIELLRSKLTPGIEVASLRDAYPAGDEFVMVYEILGRVIPPGAIPLAVGAVVMNVETAMNVARAAQTPVVEKYLTIAGAVAEPVSLRVPVGITMGECVAAAGGPTIPDPNYIIGGAMMGYLEDNIETALVTKTTGGIIVLPDDNVVVQRNRQNWDAIARIGRSACDQCSFCSELCPRWLLGHPVEPHRAMRSLGFNLSGKADVLGTSFCCECNLCTYYACPESLDPCGVMKENKGRLMAEKRRWENPPFNERRADLLVNNRKAPTSRLMQRLGLKGFNNKGPLRESAVQTRKVGIALKQHIGAPCEPTVAVGQSVARGQEVGRLPVTDGKPALGAPVHASIDGTVTGVDETTVWIES